LVPCRTNPVRSVSYRAQRLYHIFAKAGKESQDVFLLALRHVAEAHKISKVALAAGVNRETLYRTLSARGNPTFTTLESILAAVGVELHYRPREKRKRNLQASDTPAAHG